MRCEDWHVVAVGRNERALRALASECGAEALCIDIRDTVAVARQLASRRIDAVVHAAGVLSSRALFQDIEPDAIITVHVDTRHLMAFGTDGRAIAEPATAAA